MKLSPISLDLNKFLILSGSLLNGISYLMYPHSFEDGYLIWLSLTAVGLLLASLLQGIWSSRLKVNRTKSLGFSLLIAFLQLPLAVMRLAFIVHELVYPTFDVIPMR